jgi:TRAP-type C4-dicarboxylate transport system substrate-binding protein
MLAGCTSAAGSDRLGGKTGEHSVSVTVMSPDGGNGAGPPQNFVDALAHESDGNITAKLDSITYAPEEGAPDAEALAVKDLAAGKIDAVVAGVRAFNAAGIDGLGVLEAPFTVTSFAAESDLVTSPISADLLARLEGTGIHALALAAGPLRRPLSTGAALLTPSDWAGQAFRTYASPVQDAAVTALGGIPRHERFHWYEQMLDGKLRGAEGDVALALSKDAHYGLVVPTNVVLWPKFYVVAVSQRFYDSLEEPQRAWLAKAADAVRLQSVATAPDETADAAELCQAGVRFATATAQQLAALRAQVAPVLQEFAADPVLPQLEAFAAAHPASTVQVGPECRSQLAAHKPAPHQPAGPPLPTLPDGTYRVTITEQQVLAAGDDNNDGFSGEWSLTVDHGHFTLRCNPNTGSNHDCGNAGDAAYGGPLEAGVLEATSTGLTFHVRAADLAALARCKLPATNEQLDGHCAPDGDYSTGPWQRSGDEYTFGPGLGDGLRMAINPWTKIQ